MPVGVDPPPSDAHPKIGQFADASSGLVAHHRRCVADLIGMDVETRGMPARGIIAAVGLAGALALPGVAVLLTSISVGTPPPSSAVSTTAPPAVPTVPSEVAGLQVERDDLARHTQELEARNAWLAAIVESQRAELDALRRQSGAPAITAP